jgi:hypothetical protein
MPHEPGHTNENNTVYTVSHTGETYNGLVVKIGKDEFTTQSGTFEGTSQKLTRTNNVDESDLEALTNVDKITPFVVGDNSVFGRGNYYYNDGRKVARNIKLHHHTIVPAGRTSNFMTQHTMDGNEQDVFTFRKTQGTGAQTETQTSTRRTSGTRNRTSGGSMGGGRGGY